MSSNDRTGIRMLMVDDHQLFADAMRSMLQKQWPDFYIECVHQGDHMLERVAEASSSNPWNLVMLDLGLPDQDGLTLVSRLREEYPALPILVCTAESRPPVLNRVIQSPANGVITKSQPAEEILEAISAVLAGRRYLCPECLDAVALPTPPEEDLLTERQLSILALLQDGLSNSEIAERLFVSPNTVKTHLRLIFEKLGVSNRVECVREAHERGLIHH